MRSSVDLPHPEADQHRELVVGDVDVDAVSDGGSVGTAEAYAKDS